MQRCPFEDYCQKSYNDGKCDEGCNRAECAWDGLDCETDKDPEIADGELVLTVDYSIEELEGDPLVRSAMLRTLSIILHTNLVIALNADGSLKMKSVSTEADFVANRSRRAASLSNTQLYFEIDNRACLRSDLECFQNAQNAQSMLAAEYRLGNTATPGFNMLQADFVPSSLNPTAKTPMYVVLGSCIIIMTVTVFYGVVTHKKKKIRTKLWKGMGVPDPTPQKKIVNDQRNFQMNPYQPSQSWSINEYSEDPKVRSPLLPSYDDSTVDFSRPGKDGIVPLHLLAKSGTEIDKNGLPESGNSYESEDMITRLISRGAPADVATDTYNETPLHIAARYARADAAKKLLAAGADPNVRDWTGRTPLHTAIAADAHGVFTILLNHQHGSHRTDLEARADDGSTALILAARLEIENVVEQMIQHHVDVNAVDTAGKSALHWAAEVNNKQACELLLKHGANKDIQNEREETPLFLAAKEGSLDCVHILISHFANRDITDFMDRLPRDIAAQKMHTDIVDLLEKPINSINPMFDHSVAPFSMGQYQPKKMAANSKKRQRPSTNQRSNQPKRKKTATFSPTAAQQYSKSIGNLPTAGYGPGGMGSTTLSPPNEHRTPPHHQSAYHTLHAPSRLVHSQSISNGLSNPYNLMNSGVDLNQSMPYHSSTLYEHNWSMHPKHPMQFYHQHQYSKITHTTIQSPLSNPYPL